MNLEHGRDRRRVGSHERYHDILEKIRPTLRDPCRHVCIGDRRNHADNLDDTIGELQRLGGVGHATNPIEGRRRKEAGVRPHRDEHECRLDASGIPRHGGYRRIDRGDHLALPSESIHEQQPPDHRVGDRLGLRGEALRGIPITNRDGSVSGGEQLRHGRLATAGLLVELIERAAPLPARHLSRRENRPPGPSALVPERCRCAELLHPSITTLAVRTQRQKRESDQVLGPGIGLGGGAGKHLLEEVGTTSRHGPVRGDPREIGVGDVAFRGVPADQSVRITRSPKVLENRQHRREPLSVAGSPLHRGQGQRGGALDLACHGEQRGEHQIVQPVVEAGLGPRPREFDHLFDGCTARERRRDLQLLPLLRIRVGRDQGRRFLRSLGPSTHRRQDLHPRLRGFRIARSALEDRIGRVEGLAKEPETRIDLQQLPPRVHVLRVEFDHLLEEHRRSGEMAAVGLHQPNAGVGDGTNQVKVVRRLADQRTKLREHDRMFASTEGVEALRPGLLKRLRPSPIEKKLGADACASDHDDDQPKKKKPTPGSSRQRHLRFPLPRCLGKFGRGSSSRARSFLL